MDNFDSVNIKFVIAHTLKTLGAYSTAAAKLLELTASLQAEHFSAKPQSGLGLYRIEPCTHLQIWDGYLAFKPDLASTVRGLASQKAFLQNPHLELATNQGYASAIAWMIYQRRELTLPDAEDQQGLTACWTKYFTDSAKPVQPNPRPCPQPQKPLTGSHSPAHSDDHTKRFPAKQLTAT
ncbi:MAG: hypothetical protein DRQ64_07580 [Gammaproteobacteria bacterium]|nr:MAG: hypothetical protein DRQ64_07580 [Gammaproteobacteria bacterium]